MILKQMISKGKLDLLKAHMDKTAVFAGDFSQEYGILTATGGAANKNWEIDGMPWRTVSKGCVGKPSKLRPIAITKRNQTHGSLHGTTATMKIVA